MSVTPNNLPKRTFVLIKDLIFQEKYNLTHSQMDLMAYIVNACYWAISVDGYFVLTTSKIMSDLPHLGIKTIEANLKALKDLKLIEIKIVEVKEWNGNPRLRGVKLTAYGEEYNNHYITPMDDKERKELKDKIKELEAQNKKLEEALANLQTPQDQTQNSSESATLVPNNTELKLSSPSFAKNIVKLSKEEENFTNFIDDVTKKYQKLSKPICNCVPTWQKEVEFYINSYNKLTIKLPNGEFRQIDDPNLIHKFWKYLYNNPSHIGRVIDFSKPLNYSELVNRYRFTTIRWGKDRATIVNFHEKDIAKTASIEILVDGSTESMIIQAKGGGDAVLAFEYIEGFILKNRI
jgi:DNA-binding PadR family transcriptional regulator